MVNFYLQIIAIAAAGSIRDIFPDHKWGRAKSEPSSAIWAFRLSCSVSVSVSPPRHSSLNVPALPKIQFNSSTLNDSQRLFF